MSLEFYDIEIIPEKNVTILSSAASKVEMYGNKVWEKYTPKWITLFSGSQSFTQGGSMTVSGINVGDTVDVSANLEVIEYVDDQEYSNLSNSITRKNLPALVEYYASAYLTVGKNTINFTFDEYYEPYKGADVVYVPVKLTITEVRVLR